MCQLERRRRPTSPGLSVALALLIIGNGVAAMASSPALQHVRVADDGMRFVFADSDKTFVPWGFNYDHDDGGLLLEDYWQNEWPRIEEDFREMRELGANVVRVHLQLSRFMLAADMANPDALRRLEQLVQLAERERLYLDLTGLGCYHKQDVPEWYDGQTEEQRWATQARFWEAVAERCAGSPAIFCYDLMNEPVVPANGNERADWLGPPFAGKHFVQFITRKTGERNRPEVARAWIEHLVTAIRRHDRTHMITVGLVPWSLDRPGLSSGFVPTQIAEPLDFLCVHLYPERDKVDEAVKTLRGFAVGKPVLIEETFPLRCGVDEFGRFLDASRAHSAGWIGFYWGKTREECRASNRIPDKMMLGWLNLFADRARQSQEP